MNFDESRFFINFSDKLDQRTQVNLYIISIIICILYMCFSQPHSCRIFSSEQELHFILIKYLNIDSERLAMPTNSSYIYAYIESTT